MWPISLHKKFFLFPKFKIYFNIFRIFRIIVYFLFVYYLCLSIAASYGQFFLVRLDFNNIKIKKFFLFPFFFLIFISTHSAYFMQTNTIRLGERYAFVLLQQSVTKVWRFSHKIARLSVWWVVHL